MPSPRYATLLAPLMFTALPNDVDLPECLYDDPEANELLGIRRGLPGNMSRLNLPTSVKRGQGELFRQFLTVVENKTSKQLKESPLGSPAQWSAWHSFAMTTLSGGMNNLVERVMLDRKRHPMDLMELSKEDTWSSSWVGSYGGFVANGVAETLLGEERMFSAAGQELTAEIVLIVSQNYERLRKNHKRLSDRLAEVEAALDKATAALFDSENVTIQDVRAAAIGVKKFTKATSLFPNARGKADAPSALLAGLMTRLGVEEKDLAYNKANKKAVEKARQRGRKLKMDPADLANKEAVQQIVNMYLDFFHREDGELNLDEGSIGELWNDACNDSGDMGVERMQTKTQEELCNLLSFQQGRPINWNSFRSVSNSRTAWEETDEVARAKFETGGDGMQELSLLWHQLVGVASLAVKAWGTDPRHAPFGILLADEVGVGKTAQVMAFIALLQLVNQCEVNGQSRPPILEYWPSFMGRGKVPNAPHAIIVPNSLVDQWRRELKCFFKPGAIDIFVLPTARVALQDYFKRENSPWTKSHHDEIFRVVLVPHSVFNTLTSMSFTCERRKPLDSLRDMNRAAPEFFKKEWCSAWIDEAHDFRTPTRSFIGAIHLRNRTRIMSCCTATPLFTKPQDVVNIGRIIGVPTFLGVEGADWEKENSRAWNRAQRAITKEEKLQFRQAQEDMLLNKSTDTPTVSKEVQQLKLQYIKSIQKEYWDHIIRRTKDSKRLDGRSINDLPSLTNTVIPITLTQEEMNILNEALGDVLENRRNTSLTDFNSEKFYIHYRLNIAYPVGSSEEDKRNDFPSFKSIEQWEKRPGSKLLVLIGLLKHLLKDDAIEHVKVEGSEVVYPPPPQHEGAVPTRTRKILVYYEYPMTTPSIESAMIVNGIKPYVINGSMKVKERDEKVQAFVSGNDPDRRVLLFSSVGAAGLNLACADVVILYDMVWSDQAKVQIVGRAHRLGQTRPVHVYHLLAIGTTDVIISSMAREKDEMLQALLTRTIKEAPGLTDVFKPPTDDEESEDEIQEVAAPTKKGKKKASGKTTPREKKGKKVAASKRPSEPVTSTPAQSTSGEPETPTPRTTAEPSQSTVDQPPIAGEGTPLEPSPSKTTTHEEQPTVAGEDGAAEEQDTQIPVEKTPALPPSNDATMMQVGSQDKGKAREDPPPHSGSEDMQVETPDDQSRSPTRSADDLTSLVASASITNEEGSSTTRKRHLQSPNANQPKPKRREDNPDDSDNPRIGRPARRRTRLKKKSKPRRS
ncbi:P-loop containing nucleoside triphosphate hydrolase protein [Amanita muscaria]